MHLEYSNGYIVKKRESSFKNNAQQVCKFFREEVFQLSLKTMGDIFDVKVQTLSAWEHGKSSNVNFLSYYYDCIGTDNYKKIFLKLVFNSENKKVKVIINKKLHEEIAKNFFTCESIDIETIPCLEGEQSSMVFQVNNIL